MKKAAVRAVTTNAAVAHGVELATLASATAAEALRARRDPAVVARKRRRAAKRRVSAWSAGAVVSGALTATGAVSLMQEGVEAGAIGAMIFLTALLVWCVVGIVRATVDLRARNRVLAALPVPAPARPAVAGPIRPDMARLNGYSDGLRQLVGMIGIADDDSGVRALRDEILQAADVSEARLRQQATDVTGLIGARRTAPPEAAPQLDTTVAVLREQIRVGVDGYGQLVSAASEAVAASRALADRTENPGIVAGPAQPGSAVSGTLHPELEGPIDQLRSLAAGMRELTEH